MSSRLRPARTRPSIIRRIARCCIAAICAAAFAACAARPPYEPTAATDPQEIWVVRRGWHVDIGLPVPELTAQLAPLGAAFPGAHFLIVGFGDRRYLLHRGRGGDSSGAVAALWPGPGLLLVTGLTVPPPVAFGSGRVLALAVSPEQSRRAQIFVRESLAAGFAPVAAGPYPGSLFFASSRRYDALYTCNTWAAQVLAAAGLPVHARGVMFAGQVWRQAGRLSTQ